MNRILSNALTAAAVLTLSASTLLSVGCQTDTDGVKSNYMQQYADVIGTTEDVVNAAQDVLVDYNLTDITGKSTKLDGEARGLMADGTKVWVTATHKSDTTSEVTVQVGKMGDNDMGQKILADIKKQLAEQNM